MVMVTVMVVSISWSWLGDGKEKEGVKANDLTKATLALCLGSTTTPHL